MRFKETKSGPPSTTHHFTQPILLLNSLIDNLNVCSLSFITLILNSNSSSLLEMLYEISTAAHKRFFRIFQDMIAAQKRFPHISRKCLKKSVLGLVLWLSNYLFILGMLAK